MERIAGVAVNDATFQFDKIYSYRVPQSLADQIQVGSLVLVPFGQGNRPRTGIALSLQDLPEDQLPKRLKTLHDVAPEQANLTPELLKLVYFLREHTFCTFYEAVKAMLPYGAQYKAVATEEGPRLQKQLVRHTEPEYRLVQQPPEGTRLGARQKQALEQLKQGSKTASELAVNGISQAVMQGLCKKGWVTAQQVNRTLDLFGQVPCGAKPIVLSQQQEQAYQGLSRQLQAGKASAALLHGVTASGKTLVFLKLVEQSLALGKSALILVPEISLTPQMIRRLRQTFGSQVAVQHSGLNHTERLLQWQLIHQGRARVVVGTRSAIFAPLQNIGLIVVDEEQEHTYQSESAPRYDAREVAKRRAVEHNCLVLFASATPSVESYQAALEGRYTLYKLTQRYASQPLPTVELVDMKKELEMGNPYSISRPLAQRIEQTLQQGNQVILLLNRRGYQTVGMCTSCSKVLKCESCSVPMVYHKSEEKLMCHYCGKSISPVPTTCPDCGGRIRYRGFGTQRVEEELKELFPSAGILRMDQDSTSRKNAHEIMLARFAKGEYQIMLGTQMVAKGLDFERVTLVGVLGIDALLFSQGFRSTERVFSLLTQVIGRGGRSQQPGYAMIQTVDPTNPVLSLAATQDYEDFFRQEIQMRKLCLYPPFCSLCLAVFSGPKEGDVIQAARALGQLLAEAAQQAGGIPLRILGPVPMNIAMVKDHFRYKLTIKCRNDKRLRGVMRQIMEQYSQQGLVRKASLTLDFHSDGD